MKFCPKCGASITALSKFCAKCGHSFNTDSSKQVQNNDLKQSNNAKVNNVQKSQGSVNINAQQSNNNSSNLNFFKTKGFKIILSCILSILILGFAGYKTLNIMNSPEKTINKFQEAINKKDSKALAKLLQSTDTSLEIDNKAAKAIIKSIDDGKINLKEIIASLNNDIKLSHTLRYECDEALLTSSESFALTIQSENALFTKYAILIQPIYVNVSSSGLEATIYANDTEVGVVTGDKKIGPLLPGTTELTAKAKNIINEEISETQSISLTSYDEDSDDYDYDYDDEDSDDYDYDDENDDKDDKENTVTQSYTAEFFKEYGYYSIASNIEDAKIYVNGKDTGKIVKDSYDSFGPVNKNDNIYLRYTANNINYKTEETTFSSNSWQYIDLYFSSSDYSEISRYLTSNQDNTDNSSSEISENAQKYIDKYSNIDYMIPGTETEELNFKALNPYTYEELYIARNEMLARHGYVFEDYPDLQKYFESKSWYKADSSFDGILPTDIEKSNEGYLKSVEFLKMAYEDNYSISYDYVFRDSDIEELTASQIRFLNDWELIVARNEIFARYGLAFSTKELLEHFKNKKWFVIDDSVGNDVKLNEVENKNIALILDEEKKRMNTSLNHDLGEE